MLHNGTGVVVNGLRTGQVQSELYVVPLDGGNPAVISDGGVTPYSLEVSRDDNFVAALALSEVLTLYRTDGGPSVPLPELEEMRCQLGGRQTVSFGSNFIHTESSRATSLSTTSRNIEC